MAELATPRQRVWFQLRSDISRDQALEMVAGLLLREKPEGTAILSLDADPPSEGGDVDDPGGIETFIWELQFPVDESQGRDWDWGHEGDLALQAFLFRDPLAGEAWWPRGLPRKPEKRPLDPKEYLVREAAIQD